jgi:hypothetical protein
MKLKNILNEVLRESNLNANFKKWFGNSKISNGSTPTICFHGTNAEITKFSDIKKGSNTDPGLRGRGFYFTDNINTAKAYGSNVYEVYLKIDNPFDLLSFESLEKIIELLEIDESIIHERDRGTSRHSIRISPDFAGVFSGAVRENGYDGILHGQEIVCFKAEQIKSIKNDGSWDTNDDNIYS